MHLFDELVRKMLMENPAIETKEIQKQITAMGYNGSTTAGYESVSRIEARNHLITHRSCARFSGCHPKPVNYFTQIDRNF
jgi:hypothetical protein